MIVDLEATDGTVELRSDLCIIGSGAAGLAIASEMVQAQMNVILVESGGKQHEPATQALYDVAISGLPHPGSTQGRFRILGGSTTKWGGQTLPLMPSDFEQREWVPHSGWPISFEELRAYYERAFDSCWWTDLISIRICSHFCELAHLHSIENSCGTTSQNGVQNRTCASIICRAFAPQIAALFCCMPM